MRNRKHAATRVERRTRSRPVRRRARKTVPELEGDLARTVCGIPALEIGRRIEAYAQYPLADLLRESYWMSKGEKVWKQVCRNSLKARCSWTWVEAVRRLGRA